MSAAQLLHLCRMVKAEKCNSGQHFVQVPLLVCKNALNCFV